MEGRETLVADTTLEKNETQAAQVLFLSLFLRLFGPVKISQWESMLNEECNLLFSVYFTSNATTTNNKKICILSCLGVFLLYNAAI